MKLDKLVLGLTAGAIFSLGLGAAVTYTKPESDNLSKISTIIPSFKKKYVPIETIIQDLETEKIFCSNTNKKEKLIETKKEKPELSYRITIDGGLNEYNSEINKAIEKMKTLPMSYQEAIIEEGVIIRFCKEREKESIFNCDLPDDAIGIYSAVNNQISIDVKKSSPNISEVLLHEYGHAIDYIIGDEIFFNGYGQYSNLLGRESTLLSSIELIKEYTENNTYKGSTHLKNPIELFAEGFQDYYLSKESNSNLKTEIPFIHDYFSDLEKWNEFDSKSKKSKAYCQMKESKYDSENYILFRSGNMSLASSYYKESQRIKSELNEKGYCE